MVDDEELLELVEMEITELLRGIWIRRTAPIIKGSALKALEDPMSEWGDKIMELMDTIDDYIPDPQRATDQAIPYASRRRIHNHRSWYSCYR